ncbi:MAG: hypothetical protein ACYC6W_10985 [Nitrosotalea sp.]
MSTTIPLEDEECIVFYEWAQYHPICRNYLIHIANEGKTSFNYGKKLKKMGKKAGVCDYFLAYPSNGYHGLWIEMKRNKKYTLSQIKTWDLQYDFMKNMLEVNYLAQVTYGAQEAISLIKKYLGES